jgi:hypothetical protein
VVLVDVRARPRLDALGRDAGAHDLGQAIDVEGRQRERGLDLLAESLGPRLGAEDAGAQPQPRHVLDVVGDRERVAGRAAEDLGPQVLEQLRLTGSVPARSGHDRAAEPLGAVVKAEAAGEQAVAVGDVNDRPRPSAGRRDRAGAAVGPAVDVAPRIGDDRRLAARARRGVDADALGKPHTEKPEWIRVSKLLLRRERLLRKPLALDAEPFPKPLRLEELELRPRQRFHLGLEDHGATL